MIRRLVGLVAGLAVGVGLVYGLDAVVEFPLALAVGAGTGAAVFLVLDGSAGPGEGWIYHRVRARGAKLLDGAYCAGAGIGLGTIVTLLTPTLPTGTLGSSILVLFAALFGANAAFIYRRPNYEEQLEDMEE